MGKGIEVPDIGMEYGRPDMERIGLFAEMSYLVGKKYTPVLKFSDIRDPKKRQMFPGGSKIKTGLQDCYFETDFKRLFIGEGYPRKRKDEPGKKGKSSGASKGPAKPFYPSNYPNPVYYPGECYGYFSTFEEFSPKQKPKPPAGKEKRGIYASAPKFGGPGYTDMCLNPFPAHMPDKYDPVDKKKPKEAGKKKGPFVGGQPPRYFDPNPYFDDYPEPPYKKMNEVYMGKKGPKFKPSSPAKWDGGCKQGTLDPFPEYIEDRYIEPRKIDKVLEQIKNKKNKQKKRKPIGLTFKPPACCRTLQAPSVMATKAQIAVNEQNWQDIEPVTFTEKCFLP